MKHFILYNFNLIMNKFAYYTCSIINIVVNTHEIY